MAAETSVILCFYIKSLSIRYVIDQRDGNYYDNYTFIWCCKVAGYVLEFYCNALFRYHHSDVKCEYTEA